MLHSGQQQRTAGSSIPTSSFLSFFWLVTAHCQVGFDLGKLGASAITAFALDGETTSGSQCYEAHGGLRKRGVLMEAHPYKRDDKQEAADTRVACRALWEALYQAILVFLETGEAVRVVVGVLGVDADLKATAETLEEVKAVPQAGSQTASDASTTFMGG
uniref:Uncharacterized protein n=1 Tax=Chromera velia CCMP2878 TaxID=1169474 RepID=A0A0G4GUM7_9ALVE|eukprot:Cvel_5234.t1-p1 / transcript=Cvel_5234.t1 / gene=Cvel_5234 / organism=Chromera_velia_CCMP2878 / gene_product=hypothetical protein / transcript_product=hypothetical protein / location=Cvel_scaffold241:14957-17064(-) / protein_length=159 / sequence_SO=supercontig / SO=protein_coding / is_pseudo=false